MRTGQTLYDTWIADFRKILVCMIVIVLGTLYNIRVSNALAIAVIVQGISNIDGFWDFLGKKELRGLLKMMCALLIFFSLLAVLIAVVSMAETNKFFDIRQNKYAVLIITFVLICVSSPIILLVTDLKMNLKCNLSKK